VARANLLAVIGHRWVMNRANPDLKHAAPTVIVGATGGVGQALARRVAARGGRLHLVARREGPLVALSAELGATCATADVLEGESLAAAITAAGTRVGALAYAVGSIRLRRIGSLTDREIIEDFTLNALGAARAVRAALPAMRAFEGTASVLLFSTVAVSQGFASHASVSMAKGAVEGLTRALAAELAPKVCVNAIAPSLTRTPLAQPILANEATATAIGQMHALQRLGEVDDIAPLAELLLSPSASWITGQVIGVDGGRATLRTKG
jgi:NAD(P)-dependent dehydrogenase (short-subunit alcohol dehydrogenase family)